MTIKTINTINTTGNNYTNYELKQKRQAVRAETLASRVNSIADDDKREVATELKTVFYMVDTIEKK